MPYFEPHGGGCCGVSHIYEFDLPYSESEQSSTGETEEAYVRRILAQGDSVPGRDAERGHLYEVVLTEDQARDWYPILADLGFREVAYWINSNSGNPLYMYVRFPTPKRERGVPKI